MLWQVSLAWLDGNVEGEVVVLSMVMVSDEQQEYCLMTIAPNIE
jgi:hypothetical protein